MIISILSNEEKLYVLLPGSKLKGVVHITKYKIEVGFGRATIVPASIINDKDVQKAIELKLIAIEEYDSSKQKTEHESKAITCYYGEERVVLRSVDGEEDKSLVPAGNYSIETKSNPVILSMSVKDAQEHYQQKLKNLSKEEKERWQTELRNASEGFDEVLQALKERRKMERKQEEEWKEKHIDNIRTFFDWQDEEWFQRCDRNSVIDALATSIFEAYYVDGREKLLTEIKELFPGEYVEAMESFISGNHDT